MFVTHFSKCIILGKNDLWQKQSNEKMTELSNIILLVVLVKQINFRGRPSIALKFP